MSTPEGIRPTDLSPEDKLRLKTFYESRDAGNIHEAETEAPEEEAEYGALSANERSDVLAKDRVFIDALRRFNSEHNTELLENMFTAGATSEHEGYVFQNFKRGDTSVIKRAIAGILGNPVLAEEITGKLEEEYLRRLDSTKE